MLNEKFVPADESVVKKEPVLDEVFKEELYGSIQVNPNLMTDLKSECTNCPQLYIKFGRIKRY